MIACGWSHSTAVCVKTSDTSALYTWGKGDTGQLGLGDREDRLTPTEISMESSTRYSEDAADRTISSFPASKIISVSAGYFHTGMIVRGTDGNTRVYTWGWGENGQLGHGSLEDESVPRFVESLQSVQATRIACGGAHTLVIAEGNACYAFGNNQFSQLGVDNIPDSPKDKKSTQEVELGTSAEATVTHGFSKMRTVPTQVQVEGYKMLAIACGWWHTVAIVQNVMQSIITLIHIYNPFFDQ